MRCADCNENGVPDECDIVDCPAGEPSCGDCNGNDVVDECELAGGVVVQVAKLTGTGVAAGDRFGESVAISGARAVVGGIGGFRIFRSVHGVWEQKYASSFRASVAIDGATVVAGAGQSGRVYIYREVDDNWQFVAQLQALSIAFGTSVAISGNTVIVGAPADGDDPVFESGAAFVFRESNGVWQQMAKLKAADHRAFDRFGKSVSIDGETAVVGAYFDDDGGSNSGSAYVFREVGGLWQQVAKLTANDPAVFDQFGWSVSIDGEAVVVGAYGDDDGGSDSGSAYVFREVGGVWQQVGKVTATDASSNDRFGSSVALSGDTVVVGADGDDELGGDSGAAYVFREIEGSWQQMAKLAALDGAADDHFGFSVSVSSGTVLIGANQDDDCGLNSGSAYVLDLDYRADDCNENGIPDECDIADCPPGDASCTDCDDSGIPDGCEVLVDCNGNGVLDACDLATGNSIDCNSNSVPDECEADLDCNGNGVQDICDIAGGTSAECNGNGIPDECDLADGSSADCDGNAMPDECEPNFDCNGNGVQDICDLFAGTSSDCNENRVPDECDVTDGTSSDEDGNGVPDECGSCEPVSLGELRCEAPYCSDLWGFSVAIDGGTAVIGAPDDVNDQSLRSQVRVMTRGPGGTWEHQALLSAGEGSLSENFGWSVAIDGDTIVVGSYLGAAYVFVRSGGVWTQEGMLESSDGSSFGYGASVAVDGDTVVIGARRADGADYESGAAYVFVRAGGQWTQQAKLFAADGMIGDLFGRSVAVDGDTIVVGADRVTGEGRAYVFVQSGESWLEQARLRGADVVPGDGFGWSVALSGESALVGAYAYSMSSNPGEAYVFVRTGGVWQEQARLTPTPAERGFGWSVSLDGDTAIIGESNDTTYGDMHGAAHVYRRAGGKWAVHARLESGQTRDYFGYSVAVDEVTALVGAPHGGSGSGLVYSYQLFGYPILADCNENSAADECETDCNGNGVPDDCDVTAGTSADCNGNLIPDECEAYFDCNANGVRDNCEVAAGTSADCNVNRVPDECDLGEARSRDCNASGVPDECEGFTPAGDMDGDCHIGLADFMTFSMCFGGAGAMSPPDGCAAGAFAAADLDGDGDVDLGDFMTFATTFGT